MPEPIKAALISPRLSALACVPDVKTNVSYAARAYMPPDIVAAVAPAHAGSDRWRPAPGLGGGRATANGEADMNKFAQLGKSILHRNMKAGRSGALFLPGNSGIPQAKRGPDQGVAGVHPARGGTASAAVTFDRP